MLSRIGIFLIIVILIFLSLSCAKIDQPAAPSEGNLVFKALPSPDSIPLEYGNLISVSSAAGFPHWVQLWFQDENGILRMVRYSIYENRLAKNFHLIPRK